MGTPWLKKHNGKLHFNQSGCKISGNFQTEMGFSRINLKTNYNEKKFMLSSNLTQINEGYNEVMFENNKVVLQPIWAEISYPDIKGLNGPETVKINPNAIVGYRSSGWPFIKHSTLMNLPLISKENIKSKTISVTLNFTQRVLFNHNVLSGKEKQKAEIDFMRVSDFTSTNN